MINELKNICSCISYFTRIPIWKLVDLSDVDMKQTSKYFPIIGWLVGCFSAFILYCSKLVLPYEISIILSMITSLIITGAIHEDGFADVCDGFGGGYTKERILDIMKDSSTGAFGSIGLIMILGLKFSCLYYIPTSVIVPVIITAHTISRWTSISFLYTHNYARSNDNSKSSVFIKHTPLKEFIIISIFGIIPFFLLPSNLIIYSVLLIVPVYMVKTILGAYFNRKIGGYTGDCMGAVQQISEIIFYIGIIIILNLSI